MTTTRRLLALIAIAGFLTSALVACGDDREDSGTNNGNPNNGLLNNGNNGNNGTSNNGNNGNNEPGFESDFGITYVARNRNEVPGIERGGKLFLVSSDGTERVQVNPDGIECHLGCRVSGDHAWFVWIEEEGGGTVLKAAPITSYDYGGVQVDLAAETTIATDAPSFEVKGSTIAYTSSAFDVYAGDLPGTSVTSLGKVGDPEGTQGGFHLSSDGKVVVTWTVTLTTMTMSLHDLEAGTTEEGFYTLSSEGFGGTGSFYGPREKMAVSPDHRYLAIVSRGLVDTNPCQSNDQCIQPAACSLTTGRCTEQRLTLNMIDLDALDRLDGSCTSDSECGFSHFCDFADPADPASGKCLPGRMDLGPAGPAAQDCRGYTEGNYTEIRDFLHWSPTSKSLYFLAADKCANLNIPRTNILKTTPKLDSPEPVLENPGLDFAPERCYDFDEEEYVVESPECVLDIQQIALSPTGATVAFAASSPASPNNYELYSIDTAGKRGKMRFTVTEDIESVVEQVFAGEEP